MEHKSTRKGFSDALLELGATHDNVVVLDCDVGRSTLASCFGDAYPGRFFNCGVQEANMMGVAAGLALERYIPFATGFGVFLTCRALDQIRNSIAYPSLNVKIAATHCGITVGEDGASHQAVEDIALMRAIPNMTVIVPGDYEEARLATRAAAGMNGPVYLRFGRGDTPLVNSLHGEFRIGKAKILKEGTDLTIVTTGIMVSEGIEAAEKLEAKGCSTRVVHMPTVKPLDEDALRQAARETKGIVTVEEHSIVGGLGEAVSGFLVEHFQTPVKRIGIPDTFGQSGKADALLNHYGLRAKQIVKTAEDFLAGIKRKDLHH